MFAGVLIWLEAPLQTIFILGAVPVLLSGFACLALQWTHAEMHPPDLESLARRRALAGWPGQAGP
jgi:hypothetical protein